MEKFQRKILFEKKKKLEEIFSQKKYKKDFLRTNNCLINFFVEKIPKKMFCETKNFHVKNVENFFAPEKNTKLNFFGKKFLQKKIFWEKKNLQK